MSMTAVLAESKDMALNYMSNLRLPKAELYVNEGKLKWRGKEMRYIKRVNDVRGVEFDDFIVLYKANRNTEYDEMVQILMRRGAKRL